MRQRVIAVEGSLPVLELLHISGIVGKKTRIIISALAMMSCLSTLSVARATDPWADGVLSYSQGSNPATGYTNPNFIVGSPERYTGEADFGGAFASNVTPFNSAFGSDEIVSIGAGGHLTVKFDEPITNDSSHLYGVDMIIFGNSFFYDGNYPSGTVAGVDEEGPFTISVSADDQTYVTLPNPFQEGLFPTLGYLDLTDPYFDPQGTAPSDFTRPVNPNLALSNFMGLSFAQIISLYDGSGGGIPVDISASGLSSVSYVRIDVASNATSVEIDAFSTVPEPASLMLLVATAVMLRHRGRRTSN